MKIKKSSQPLRDIGITFTTLGIYQIIIGISLTREFLAVGLVCIALGISFFARSRKAPNA